MEITTEDLLQEIGVLHMEIKVLRGQLAAARRARAPQPQEDDEEG